MHSDLAKQLYPANRDFVKGVALLAAERFASRADRMANLFPDL